MDDQYIISGGKKYPAFVTMGAMLLFKRRTGREASAANGTIEDSLAWAHCLATSAANSAGTEAPPASLQDFADGITPAEFSRWSAAHAKAALAEQQAEEKKTGE